MKIAKRPNGAVLIKPESKSELLAISKVLKKGDVVSAKTSRSIEIDKGSSKEKVRKHFMAKIQIEGLKLEHGILRIKGRILNEVEFVPKFSYHSLELSEGGEIVIETGLSKPEMAYLRRFSEKESPVLACILDESQCDAYLVGNDIKELFSIKGSTGKLYEQKAESYYSTIYEAIKPHIGDAVVVAGPGFAREHLCRHLLSHGVKCISDGIVHTGRAGLRELMRRGTLERASKKIAVARESRIVEAFFEELAKGGRVAYGRQNIVRAAELGAVETLLISDEYIADPVVEQVEKMGGKVEIISSGHDTGRQFLEFSGYGAFLRYMV